MAQAVRPHFEVRSEGDHEWVVLIGGNGEVMMQTETYGIGHGNAERAKARLEALADAEEE